MRGTALLGGILGLALLAAPPVARADARIAVRLTDHEGRPVDGTVTLTAGSVTRSCRTTASRCTITAPAGTYTVTLRPVRGAAPAPRTLRVPASGTISLALRAGAATMQTTAVATRTTTVRAEPSGTTSSTSPAPTGSVTRAVRTPASRVTRTTGRRVSGVRRATAVRPSTTVPTSASTSGGSGGETTTAPTSSGSVARRVDATSVLAGSTARDLASGDRLAVQGRVLDGAGRPTDATLTVKRGDEVVGTARTTAGSFSLYDLPAGTYDVALRSSRGTTATGRITVGSTTSRVTLRVP